MPTSPDDCSVPLHPAALRGLELFNAGEYFEAHEALEDAWRDETGPVRLLYQGILQVAVTYLHVQHDNYEGALKLSARAGAKLAAWPATAMAAWMACFSCSSPAAACAFWSTSTALAASYVSWPEIMR